MSMDASLIECDPAAERDAAGPCGAGGGTLAVLRDVQRAYERRLQALDKIPPPRKHQLQAEVLRAWVGDLVGQNALLVRAVEDLEIEATAQLFRERRRHNESARALRGESAALRRRLARKDADLAGLLELLRRMREYDKYTLSDIQFFELTHSDIFGSVDLDNKLLEQEQGSAQTDHRTQTPVSSGRHRDKNTCGNNVNELKQLNESLYMANSLKDGEIRTLKNAIQQNEQMVSNLRNELSIAKYHRQDVSKNTDGISSTKAERGDWEPTAVVPVKELKPDISEELQLFQKRIQKMDGNLKECGSDVAALRAANLALRGEVLTLSGAAAVLMHQRRDLALRDHLKDDFIREMRRQLRHAKAQSAEVVAVLSGSVQARDTAACTDRCVRAQPRSRPPPPPVDGPAFLSDADDADDCRSPRLVGSGTLLSPNPSLQPDDLAGAGQSLDESVVLVDRTSPPIQISDESVAEIEDAPTSAGPPSSSRQAKCVKIQDRREAEENLIKGKKQSGTDGSGGVSARIYESKSDSSLQYGRSMKIKSELNLVSKDTRESFGRSSEADSPSGSFTSAHLYQNKLLATLQILQNKEETVKVQAESLAVAEARIVSLSARNGELKLEAERNARELQALQKTVEQRKTERRNSSMMTQIQEIDNQKNIVSTLQNNLGVIEDLYRECFYETAKQENLIEMLRNSYLDVRLLDKEKSDQITRLHKVINAQKGSLDKCQDIAVDVENLKVEISNFINSSNNDSGVWEESVAGSVTGDLQEIAEQLLRLGEILTGDCTCGLQEENMRLRKNNETLEAQMEELRQKVADLENIREIKDTADEKHQQEIRAKESEMHSIRQQLAAVEFDMQEKETCQCEYLKNELQQAQVLLREKSSELASARARCARLERAELDRAQEVDKECCSLRGSVCAAQRCLRSVRGELARTLQHGAQLDGCRCDEVAALKEALREAQACGAALSSVTSRAARNVRAWARRKNDLHREQEVQLKQKDSRIKQLERRLSAEQRNTTNTRASDHVCSGCASSGSRTRRGDQPPCSDYQRAGSSTSVTQKRGCATAASASETGSEPPVPPLRQSRIKRYFCENRVCSGIDAHTLCPEGSDAVCGHSRDSLASDMSQPCSSNKSRDPAHSHTPPPHGDRSQCHQCMVARDVAGVPRAPWCGSMKETLGRVKSADAALKDSLRRWKKHHTLNHT